MDEGGKDGQNMGQMHEANNVLANRLQTLVANDPEKYIHNPIYLLSHDKITDKSTKTKVGDIIKIGHENTFIILLKERESRQIFVITPKGAPEAHDEHNVDTFYDFIHYNRSDATGHFDEDISYSFQGLATVQGQRGLAEYLESEGMVLARSGKSKDEMINAKLTQAFAYGTQLLGLPEGNW